MPDRLKFLRHLTLHDSRFPPHGTAGCLCEEERYAIQAREADVT